MVYVWNSQESDVCVQDIHYNVTTAFLEGQNQTLVSLKMQFTVGGIQVENWKKCGLHLENVKLKVINCLWQGGDY